jgi:beta-ribofuranosylaminobenzene 5'-phosphate synthase
MPHHVTVTTGARLHFGPLSVGATASGRTFGGVGVMVDRPGFRVEFTQQQSNEIEAGERRDRVRRCLDRCRNVVPIPACRIRVIDAPPAHAGFGAGTQLALAVAAGLFRIGGQRVPRAQRLAEIAGRGRRSAVGIHGFEQGGFLVDAGKSGAGAIGVLACRIELPPAWRFLLVTPADERGLSGEHERTAFERLPPMPAATTDRLCRLVLTALLPAAHAGDSRSFGAALTEYGRLVGEYFAPEQGGICAHPLAPAIIEQLRAAGADGLAQTSWGPTLCALIDSEDRAESIATALGKHDVFRNVAIHIAAPLNRGARVQTRDA